MTHPQQQLIALALERAEVAKAFLHESGTDPEAWLDEAIDALRAVLSAGAVPQQEPQDKLWRALLYWERTKFAVDTVRPDFTPDQLRELNAAEGRLLSVIEELRPAVPSLPAPQEQDQ